MYILKRAHEMGLHIQFRPPNGGFLDFRAPPVSTAAFNTTPEAAVAFFSAKGLKPTFSWADMIGAEHDAAFTVAKMMDLDLLKDVREMVDEAISTGKSKEWFRENLTGKLQDRGWWGKKDVVDPLTGQIVTAQLGSANRLNTIFRTNMQSAYSVGTWEKIQERAKTAPWLKYDAIDDHRTRPEHAQWDNLILPVGADFWDTHYPPNGWNCRCGVIQLTDAQMRRYGFKPSKPPKIKTRKWKNPRTGKTIRVPDGLDPGWDNNPGKNRFGSLTKYLGEKVEALPDGMKEKARAGVIATTQKSLAYKTMKAAAEAQKQAAIEAGKLALDMAKGKAVERAAAYTLEQIDAEKTKYLFAAKKKVLKTKAGQSMGPSDLLEAVKAQAAKDKASAALAHYKQSVLKGKKPSANAQAAFEALPAEAQADISAAIQAKKQAALAEKKAAETIQEIIDNPKGKSLKAKAIQAMKKTGEWDEMTAVQRLEKVESAAAKAQAKASQAAALSGYKKKVLGGKIPTPSQQKAFNALPDEKKQEFLQKLEQAKEQQKAVSAAAAKEPKVASGKKPKESVSLVEPEDWTKKKLTQVGPQKGSNQGGLYLDPETGDTFYIKIIPEDAARNEVLASKLYEASGVDAPQLTLIQTKDGIGVASRFVDGLEQGGHSTKWSRIPGVHDGFAVDAWLANWDVAGMGFDNLLIKGKKAFRVDVGGALRYRAQGGLKGAAFGGEVTELDSLIDASMNPYSAKMFSSISRKEIEASVRRVLAVSDKELRDMIERYGPAAKSDRDALYQTLIARKKYLAEKYPGAAKRLTPQKPAGGVINKAEVKAIEESGANGYTIPTDGDAIEDHAIVFSQYKKGGKIYTRAFFKIRPDAGRRLQASTISDGVVAEVDGTAAHDAILTAIKGVNMRAKEGLAFEEKDIIRMRAALDEIKRAYKSISKYTRAGGRGGAALKKELAVWEKKIKDKLKIAEPGKDAEEFYGYLYREKIARKLTVTQKGAAWVPDAARTYDIAKIKNGKVSVVGEAEIPATQTVLKRSSGSSKMSYIPYDKGNPYALEGVMMVDAQGGAEVAVEKIMKEIKALGIDTKKPTMEVRRELVLNKAAAIYSPSRPRFTKEYAAADSIKDESTRIKGKTRLINDVSGEDITKSDAWKNPIGELQAFGHGRRVLYRHDLRGKEFEAFSKNYSLYHNPTGLSSVGATGRGTWAALKVIIEAGGQFASQADRIRRGISVKGSSVVPDLYSGGGSYFFTRIQKAAAASSHPGVTFMADEIRRMDAVPFDRDLFGNVKDHLVERKTTVKEFIDNAKNASNETIFKDSFSIFDRTKNIILWDAKEKAQAIKDLKEMGYNVWPDGRSLDEVIITVTGGG